MMRHCDGGDPNLIARNEDSGKYEPCNCGTRFDDVDHSVVYPHHPVRVLSDLDRDALDAFIAEVNGRAEK